MSGADVAFQEIGLKGTLRRLYASDRFQLGMMIFDVTTIFAFLILTFVPQAPWVIVADAMIGALMLVELTARSIVAENRMAFLKRWMTLLDALIIASLLLPTLTGSFAFLRVLRAVRLFRALRIVKDLSRKRKSLAQRGELIGSAVNLVIFIFITSSLVYEAQVDRNPMINTFSDALYFTVTTLTTTGFGDITLTGESGRLIAVVIMIVGVSLFIKLAQSIIRPSKIHHICRNCGLSRHEPDAVHCKHCGVTIFIPNEGG